MDEGGDNFFFLGCHWGGLLQSSSESFIYVSLDHTYSNSLSEYVIFGVSIFFFFLTLLCREDREEYQMGSLSHYINCRAIGYQDLPQFPDFPTDSSVRCVAVPEEEQEKPAKPNKAERTAAANSKKKTFYSDSENGSNSEENSDDDSSDDSDSDTTDSSSDSSYEKIEPQVNSNWFF